MARTKIDYGIDLGTTNSSIARMENGDAVIKKSDGGFQKDTTPSCIHFNKKKTIFSGDKAYNILGSELLCAFKKNDKSLVNTYIEFKRTMGSDEKYNCNNMGKSFSSEELSAEVLKALKGYVRDEEINSIVITVPAKFQSVQKKMTREAAKLAGFQHCILLQEPIAASMAYGVDAKNLDGDWLVFDFGGGTFDVALMRAREGIMKVVDTDGNNHLGGKNIDYAIIDKIIIPYIEEHYSIGQIIDNEDRRNLLRNAVKRLAEDIKISLSPKDKNECDFLTDEPIGEDDDGNEIEIDITVTKDQYEEVVKPIFQSAIDISLKLLEKNKLAGSDLNTILMIGGPTFSETLRDMIRNQITTDINISIDPMTAVAVGAALLASTKDIPDRIIESDNSKIQLKLTFSADTVETEEKFGIRILRDKTEGELPEKLFVTLDRQDKGWSSGKVEIKGDAEVLDIFLEPGKSNGFTITISDEKGSIYSSEPDSFSIIQGMKIAGSTLPYDLCIDAFDSSAGKQHLIELKGLKKNQPLPAKGSGVFQTQKDIRPGNSSDKIRIPIYDGERGSRAIYSSICGEIIFSGDDLPGMLPKGSDVELSVKVNESEGITVSACFPYLDDEIIEDVIEISKTTSVSLDYLEKELSKANRSLEMLEEEYPEINLVKVEEIRNGISELGSLLTKSSSDGDTRNHVLNQLREYLKEIDIIESDGEWPKMMQEMADALERLEDLNEQYGDTETAKILKQFSNQVKTVNEKKDSKLAKDLVEQIRHINFVILDQGAGVALYISLIRGWDNDFDMHQWENNSKARQLINEAKRIIASNRATRENLFPIFQDLIQLLPKAEEPIIGKPDDDLLKKS